MRISYSDEEEFQGQFALWQANCDRSLASLKGQEALRGLESALLAMPSKRLIQHALADDAGEVCAVGALVLAIRTHRGESREAVLADLRASCSDPDDERSTLDVAEAFGVPGNVAWKLVELNDIIHGDGVMSPVTPEERYARVLAWVRARILPAEIGGGM